MLVECINCQSSVEVLDDDAASSSCPVCGSDLPLLSGDRKEPTSFPRQFGRYRLVEFLGRGHFGAVWKAFDTRLQRTVALKMPRFIGTGEGMQEMFLREGRALARLRHPGIVSVFDVDEHNGVPYIASEFINGTTLSPRFRDGRIRVDQAIEWTLTLAEALEYAHQAGVIHRDLKPGNVMVDTDGRLLLTDFGLALRPHDDSVAAGKGQILGTPAYMSPEQARGESHLTDPRSDLYSLGVMLFEMVTGRLPFGGTGEKLVNRVLHESPPRPRRLNAEVSRELESVVLKLLEKSPDRRYATAATLAEDLRCVQGGEPLQHATVEPETTIIVASERPEFSEPLSPAASTPSAFAPAAPARRRWPLWLAGAATALILSIGLLQFGGATKSAGQGEADGDPVRAAPGPTAAVEPLPVVVVTDPPGARVVAYPLDEYNSPRVDQALRPANRSPIDLKLLPGDYLIVAALDDGRFHEVYRRVPPNKFMLSDLHLHKTWDLLTDGRLELGLIRIPDKDVARAMARFDGRDRFAVGLPRHPLVPQHARRLPAYYLDITEVSVGEFKQAWNGQAPLSLQGNAAAELPPDNYPVAGIWVDDAIAHAERVGKRLPTEAEYEYAATAGGQQRFPWGDDPGVMRGWTFQEAGEPAFDVTTIGDKPVFGLFSNVAEWTATRYGPYPPKLRSVPVAPDPQTGDYAGSFVVRGGDSRVLARQPIAPGWEEIGARFRLGQHMRNLQPGLGFRCARSGRARLTAADFEQILKP